MNKTDTVIEDQDLVGMRLKDPVGRSRVAGYLRHKKVEYKILLDANGKAMRLCRLRGMPAYYLMSTDGKIHWSKYGFTPRSVPLNQSQN